MFNSGQTGASLACVSLACVVLLTVAGGASGADRYVSTSGLDTNPGTLSQPWRHIQKAADSVMAGDTVYIRGNGGVYSERVTISNKDATAAQPIIFRTYPGDPMAIVDQAGITPPDGTSALLTIQNSDYITMQDMVFRNYQTTSKAKVPIGILVQGDGNGLKLLNNKVHHIWQSYATPGDFDANAHGILVLGNAATAINGLLLDGNEVYDLRLGASEAVALNGNVTNFTVTNNRMHDSNNIGLDFIGFEGVNANAALDQARQGKCANNVVYRVDSRFNPAYGGNFTTGGGDDTRAAPGIYVDGGRDIIIERNHVYDCNFGVSVGSEHPGRAASAVRVRDNVLHHNHVGGIVMGGSDSVENGGAQGCSFTHNTLYQNDTVGAGGGQVMIQHYVTGTIIQHNLMASTADFVQFVLKGNSTGSFAQNAINWNLYSRPAASSIEFYWDGNAIASFNNWKVISHQDANSLLVATPGLVNAAPTVNSPVTDFALLSTSPAVNAGNPAFAPASGETDFLGQNRVSGLSDMGAFEFKNPTPPLNVSLAPVNSSHVAGVSRTYTSKYSDADGIPDIAEARILINSSLNGANALHGMYLVNSNRLYLRDNANAAWLGGFAPLSNNVISNSQGSLNCALTTIGGNGNTLTVNWSFTPASTFMGGKYIYMQVRDKSNLVDGFEQMGTVQIVANKAPINYSLSPNSGSSAAGTARLLTAKYYDENGATDIAEARLLVNSAASGAGALMGMYTPANNKLYLRDNTNGSWLGGFAPGSANVITNSQGSLNCAATSVTFGAQILTINWSFTPATSFTGTKNIYLLVRDRSNAVDGLEPLGSWTITSSTSTARAASTPATTPAASDALQVRPVRHHGTQRIGQAATETAPDTLWRPDENTPGSAA